VPTRRRAFRSASEEYAKILELVGRYAVHCEHVAFSCKKHGESAASLSVQANAATIDRIRQVHGSAVANELVVVNCNSERWGFEAHALASSANYSNKRTNLLLFINNRSVESTPIKKAIEQTYSVFLPKGGRPFVYLSLNIDPKRVDVNVHPTKREVRFLNEDEIISMICEEISSSLGQVDTSRTFMMQTLLPGSNVPVISSNLSRRESGDTDFAPTSGGVASGRPSTSNIVTPKPYENNLVRVDSRARKITSMLPPPIPRTPSAPDGPDHQDHDPDAIDYEYTDREQTICRLTSIKELRADVREAMHNELTDVFASHTFVGIVDERRRMAAVQSGVKLYLIDYGCVANEYLYQLGLTDFGNFGYLRLNPVLRLDEILAIGAAEERSLAGPDGDDIDWEDVTRSVKEQLINRRAMLAEYFSLEISAEGELLSLPMLVKGYVPSMAKLPQFLLRLGPFVNWNDEKACFHTFLRELASWYTPESLPPLRIASVKQAPTEESTTDSAGDTDEDPSIARRRQQVNRAVELIFFPAFKARLVATKGLLKGVVEVANLKGLYRVFERC
jgi:DNA mismatch repair protein MLH1